MKKIFVTVTEFLENGGELNNGRAIYGESGGYFGEFRGFNSFNVPIIGIARRPTSIHHIYVEIECSPIYK